jgi:two-component system chemotaxis sensor kinase CheA
MNTDRSKKDFLAEAEDILEAASQTLLGIDSVVSEGGRADPDEVNALFRAVHSFKGLAGMFGLQAPSDLAHKLEFLLDEVRLGRAPLSRDVLDVLFETLSLLGRLGQQVAAGAEAEDVSPALARIELALASPSAAADHALLDQVSLDPGILRVLSEYEEHRLRESIRERRNLFLLKASFPLASFEHDIRNLTAAVKRCGEIICTLPTAGGAAGTIGFSILFGAAHDRASLEALCSFQGSALEQVPVAAHGAETRTEAPTFRSASNTVRVDIKKLDRLMAVVGDLHLTKNVLGRISKDLRSVQGFTGFAVDLNRVQRNLERRLNELQDGILDVRMVPIGQIFTRLSQMVRKYAREAGKEIDLEMDGEDTELDKIMIEDLADPLMHLIRNAIDHGIEPPEARAALGKPEKGRVRLSAAPQGNHVVIEIEDDGAGIDPSRILAKAVEKGLLGQDHGLDPERDRKEILDLIFLPGLTTRETVTEISGRGVGMDVVRKNLAKLSGMVDIETEAGGGTLFILTIPITLAIIKAIVVEGGGERFAVPLSSVIEILRATPTQVETVEGREVMAIRGETVPLLRLNDAFGFPRRQSRELFYVIVAGLAERKLGIIVDGLRDQQEIVIKPLGKRLAETPGIAGATELGDKRVVLVVDIESLVDRTLKKAGAKA